jgi:SAM-dependent methyltransferase
MILSDIEYFILRIIRKYLFTRVFLTKYGDFLPYYKTPLGQFSPIPIVKKYLKFSSMENCDIKNKTILEIGVGVTNGTCYELALRGAHLCYAYEPCAKHNRVLDNKIISKFPYYKNILNRVIRIENLQTLNSGSIDIVFSHAVLELIEDVDEFCKQLKRVMRDGSWMLHFIVYMDHFFKYKFHFYKYHKKMWKIINPGLSRLRLSDHIRIFKNYGFDTKILEANVDMESFQKFKRKNKISGEFVAYDDDDLATVTAVIFASNIK